MKICRKFVVLLLLALVLLLSVFGCSAKSSPIEDFEYEIEDGNVIITEYIGVDRKIIIPSKIEGRPVSTIGEYAFSEYDLTSITFPKTVTCIEEFAFSDCVCLEKIVFSNGLEEIGRYAFDGCDSIKKIDLPETVKIISEFAFAHCESLEDVKLPSNLEQMRNSCFYSCESLKTLHIPDNVDLNITKGSTQHIIAGSFTSFTSPVGQITHMSSSSVTPFPTTLVVKSGSSAHQQVIKYENYLCIEVK